MKKVDGIRNGRGMNNEIKDNKKKRKKLIKKNGNEDYIKNKRGMKKVDGNERQKLKKYIKKK